LIDDIEFVAATEAVTSVKVNPSQLAMFANSTSQLTDSIFPATASNKNVSWSSSDTTVVKVNSAGLLTGKAVGTATVTVTTADGSKTSTCAVTVSAASLISNPGFEEKLKGWDDWGGLSIDSVNVHGGKYALKIASSGGGTGYGITSGFSVGQKYVLSGYGKLSSKIAPWHASFCIQFIDSTGKKTNFVSTDLSDSVAYQLKTVTATVPAGTAKILPNIWYDGFGTSTVLVDDISFGLAPAVLVTDVVVSAVAVPLAVGSTFQLSATVNPSNAGNKNIVWSTSDVTLAEVDKSGLVTAKAAGVVTITVTSEEGKKTAICTVTITSSATRVNDLKNIPGNSIIYPNPLQGNLLQINTVGIQGVKTISVFDMSGRMIFSKKLQEADYQTLDLSGLQLIGSYIVKISTDKQTVSKVLIAQ
jgi:transglutaminase/protease-like cytokinesis protein 3